MGPWAGAAIVSITVMVSEALAVGARLSDGSGYWTGEGAAAMDV